MPETTTSRGATTSRRATAPRTAGTPRAVPEEGRAVRARAGGSLAGRVALVTGGSRGLGLLLARELGRRGAHVVICARDTDDLDAAVGQLSEWGVAEASAYPCDLADRSAVDRLAGEVLARHGRVDILVNNAGVIRVGPVDALGVEDFHEAMDTMFFGALHLTMALLPGMRERRAGRIVTITSIGGKLAPPHLLPYACAKFAAVGLSEGLAAETAGSGVTVTTVVPGLMRTGSHVNASYAGRESRERQWFGAAATMPLLSMDAERAARRIVTALVRGRRQVTLTPAAKLAMRAHGVAPATTVFLSGLANRLLPRAGSEAGPAERGDRPLGAYAPDDDAGAASPRAVRQVLDWLNARGERAARTTNE